MLHDEDEIGFSSIPNFRSWEVKSVTNDYIEIQLEFIDKLAIEPGDYALAVVKFKQFTDL